MTILKVYECVNIALICGGIETQPLLMYETRVGYFKQWEKHDSKPLRRL